LSTSTESILRVKLCDAELAAYRVERAKKPSRKRLVSARDDDDSDLPPMEAHLPLILEEDHLVPEDDEEDAILDDFADNEVLPRKEKEFSPEPEQVVARDGDAYKATTK
jgi:hypothetical protein